MASIISELLIATFSIILLCSTVESYLSSFHTSMHRRKTTHENFLRQTDKSMMCMRALVDHENVIFQPATQGDLSSVAIWMARERMQVAAFATDISCMMSPAFSMVSKVKKSACVFNRT